MTTKSCSKRQGGFDVHKSGGSAEELEKNNASGVIKLSSSRLFEASKEVMIEHDHEIYILRLTRQNKLILTK
jgi:hemin uptake protein HemP